jgi:hypothetical protein
MRSIRLTLLPIVFALSLPTAPFANPEAKAAVESAPAAPKSLAIGDTAPMRELRMKSVDGRELSIADVAGKKGTLVVFMCKHCPWVQAWQSRITAVGNSALGRGIGVIAINSNDPASYPEDDFEPMKAQAKVLNMKFPYVVDATSGLASSFGATRTPEVFLFDASGKLVYHGAVDDNARDEKAVKSSWMRQAVDAVAAGKAVPVAETKALGCSIKLRERTES